MLPEQTLGESVLKLKAIRQEKIWGWEDWLLSTHPNGLQQELFDFCGGEHPLLVKVIQANEVLSVQVHPDDEQAARFGLPHGKSECWYVLQANEGAQLVCSLNRVCTKEQIKTAVESETLPQLLSWQHVRSGDFVYIPAGTVHAIGGGMRLLEVQQSSDVTLRLYDWGRGRECDVERATECIKQDETIRVVPFTGKFACEYFSLEEIRVRGGQCLSLKASSPHPALVFVIQAKEGSFVGGEAAGAEDAFAFAAGETIELAGEIRAMLIEARL